MKTTQEKIKHFSLTYARLTHVNMFMTFRRLNEKYTMSHAP